MNRRLRPTATALAATAVLLLTACGSNDDKPAGGDKIPGVDESTPAPSSTAGSDDTKRPDVSLPSDVSLKFAWDEPTDPNQAAALKDAANYLRALTHGIVKQDNEDPAYQFYSRAAATRYAKSQIDAWVAGKWTATGTDRYYNAQTAPMEGKKAVLVTFCRDQSKAFSKNVRTGTINRTEKTLNSYQYFSILMAPAKESPQVWQAGQIEVRGKAKECQA